MPASKPIAIVQMGLPPESMRTPLGDQASWFATALAKRPGEILVAQPYLDLPLPEPDTFSVAVVTGSWSMVTDKEDWSERTAAWLRLLITSGKPLLGICYGHQLMAHAMGGVVDYLPGGGEYGTFPIALTPGGRQDPLLASLPPTFMAHLSHAQGVLTPPPGAQVLGHTAHDRCQILRYGPNTLSLQFHPEFTADIISACMQRHGNSLPRDVRRIPDTSESRSILRRFVDTHTRGAAAAEPLHESHLTAVPAAAHQLSGTAHV
ncbi:MAG: glutamine amidotransferase [Candidimonas sp.]|nr:MAG: glutamine amidotransferase [Candidimonas sp.]